MRDLRKNIKKDLLNCVKQVMMGWIHYMIACTGADIGIEDVTDIAATLNIVIRQFIGRVQIVRDPTLAPP